MVGAGGQPVGRIYLTNGAKKLGLALTVEYKVPNGSYGIELRPPNGAGTTVGHVEVSDGYGWWMGTVPAPPARDAVVALVDSSGVVLCHATLGATLS